MTNEVIQSKAAIEAIYVWAQSISDACGQHATALDAQDVEIGHMKGKLARYEQQVTKGLLGADEMLNETFGKLDAVVGQLRVDSTTTTGALQPGQRNLRRGWRPSTNRSPPGYNSQHNNHNNTGGGCRRSR